VKKTNNNITTWSKAKKITIIVIAILLLFCIYTTIKTYIPKSINSSYIIKEIKESSELTTAKITYTGFHQYVDEGARFLNRGDFTMIYDATIRTGIDLDKVDVKVSNLKKTVNIKIPKARVLDVNIDESSIEFYDTKFAPFNFDSRTDVTKAIAEAKEDTKNKVVNKIDFDFANKQSEILMRGLVQKIVPKNYEIVVEIK
jgi:hypothetical protein